jgi:hypothetical protein
LQRVRILSDVVNVISFGGGPLPRDAKGSDLEEENCIVFIACGGCQHEPPGRYQLADVSNVGKRLRAIIHPDVLGGGMAAEIARVIKAGKPEFVSDGERLASKNIDKIVAALIAEDVVVGVDVTRLR